MELNPFQAPQYNEVLAPEISTQQQQVDGKFLVVRSGAVLPPYCVKTGLPVAETEKITRKLTWTPIYVLIVFVISRLIGIILYFVVRKRCDITYSLAPAVKRKNKITQWSVFFIVLGCVGGIFLGSSLNSGALIFASIVLLLVALIVLLISNSHLSATKHENGKFWIKGCSPEFMKRIQS